jgi:predicted RNase H-like nuclease
VPVLVLGVDGCRAGWVVAGAADGPVVVPVFADVLALAGDDGVVGVDIPIGLAEAGPRACDMEARRLLGRGRGSSVFPAPLRSSLAWATWAEAASMSRQTFNILAKVREVDDVMTPSLQRRVFEVHPEVSFALLAGAPMTHRKTTAEGRAQRMATLGLSCLPRVRGAAADDVLDAYAVRWTAQRAGRADERRLGDGAVDTRGLRMEIVA